MNTILKKKSNRILRKRRIRAHISGNGARPRLSVFISNLHVSAQAIDDVLGKTLASSTTANNKKDGNKTEKAAWIGTEIAKKLKKTNITAVTLDRNGRKYQGRLKALADAMRKEGLEL